jgi:hypothetical protein
MPSVTRARMRATTSAADTADDVTPMGTSADVRPAATMIMPLFCGVVSAASAIGGTATDSAGAMHTSFTASRSVGVGGGVAGATEDEEEEDEEEYVLGAAAAVEGLLGMVLVVVVGGALAEAVEGAAKLLDLARADEEEVVAATRGAVSAVWSETSAGLRSLAMVIRFQTPRGAQGQAMPRTGPSARARANRYVDPPPRPREVTRSGGGGRGATASALVIAERRMRRPGPRLAAGVAEDDEAADAAVGVGVGDASSNTVATTPAPPPPPPPPPPPLTS